jgi:hypothetical protein
VSPQNCNPDIKLKKKPTEYLNQLHFDSLVFTPEALRHQWPRSARPVMIGAIIRSGKSTRRNSPLSALSDDEAADHRRHAARPSANV